MKLLESDRIWMPQNQSLWVVIPKGMKPPKTQMEWRFLQMLMLERMMEEEKAMGENHALENEMLETSPLGAMVAEPTFDDPALPQSLLMDAPIAVESGLMAKIDSLRETLKNEKQIPTGRTPEGIAWAKDKSIATWLEGMM